MIDNNFDPVKLLKDWSTLEGIVCTDSDIQHIKNLKTIYPLDDEDFCVVLIFALTNSDKNIPYAINIAKTVFGEIYKTKKDALQAIGDFKVPPKPKTQHEQLVFYFNNTPPLQVLEDMTEGNTSEADKSIIDHLVNKIGLSPAATNVLIQYALIKTDKKLTRGYMEKIAAHWKRKGITTAEEAMKLAQKEHQSVKAAQSDKIVIPRNEWDDLVKRSKENTKRLNNRIDELEKRIAELEGRTTEESITVKH